MISSIEEVRQIRELFEITKIELRNEGISFNEKIRFGIMIEIPSIAIIVDQLINEVDFLSIGTNDLIQYTLAVDRDNDLVNSFYQPLNPAVLRLIQTITEVAKKTNKPLTLCGEMAGDPKYIPLLVGLGLTDLSMNPYSLLEAKKIVRSIEYERWKWIAKKVLHTISLDEIHRIILEEYKRGELVTET
jgi:phosphotransferase system enzyme I (PtsI)